MNSQNDVLNIQSIEELTLHSLDRSLEGIELLRRDSIHCGESLLATPAAAFASLSELAKNLHTFSVFEGDICSLFQVDTARIRDAKGTLLSVESGFRSLLDMLASQLALSDFSGLSHLLRIELPSVLDRFQDLVPILRNYIDNEYVQTPS
jgi:hypothetical protein